jgi:hypothetical protein
MRVQAQLKFGGSAPTEARDEFSGAGARRLQRAALKVLT